MRQCVGLVLIYVLIFLAAVVTGTGNDILWLGLSLFCSLLFFVGISWRRHQEVLTMVNEIDRILHGGRQVQFSNCREGDLALLRNELGKMVDRLARTTATLQVERNGLANALADISHQIRTPLTAIGLMVANLETTDDPLERKRAVRALEDMLDRVSWLVATLLKIAKVDAGALKVAQRETAVTAVVNRALAPLAMTLDLRGIEVQVAVEEAAEFVGDERWCSEALENIVKNCMEHTEPGGVIRICGQSDALATRITVTDTGPGIAPEDLPRIFDRFYRAEAPEGAKEEGFGIGLSLAQSLVQAQGGSLHASNGTSGGARFDLVFPSLVV